MFQENAEARHKERVLDPLTSGVPKYVFIVYGDKGEHPEVFRVCSTRNIATQALQYFESFYTDEYKFSIVTTLIED